METSASVDGDGLGCDVWHVSDVFVCHDEWARHGNAMFQVCMPPFVPSYLALFHAGILTDSCLCLLFSYLTFTRKCPARAVLVAVVTTAIVVVGSAVRLRGGHAIVAKGNSAARAWSAIRASRFFVAASRSKCIK